MDSGRRPELESDEFSVTTPLVVEILGREFDTFPKKVYTYWDFGSPARHGKRGVAGRFVPTPQPMEAESFNNVTDSSTDIR